MKDYLVGEYRDTIRYAEKILRGGMENFAPAIITCALTGSFQGKEVNPNLPETIDEQVQQAYDAYNAGAAMVHIHARRPDRPGEVSGDTELYREINRRIREKCPDIIINNTCMGGRMFDGAGVLGPPLRASLAARPEVASVDLMLDYSKVLYRKRVPPLSGRDEDELRQHGYVMQPEDAASMLEEMERRGIKPEYELFGLGGIKMLRRLLTLHQAEAPHWVSILFGGNGLYPTVTSMIEAAGQLPPDCMMNIIGIGAAQIPMITVGLVMGHHVRVGMEDNPFYSKGRPLKDNAEMVERAVKIARDIGRPVATPAQAREMMGLADPRSYE